MENTTTKNVLLSAETSDIIGPKKNTRRFIVIGAGDGGCNIGNAIHKLVPATYFIAYNTSNRAMENIEADIQVIPAGEDGSGKARTFSQYIFKKAAYKKLLELITSAIEDENIGADYILVTSTTDGGTGGGVSPMMAKFLSDNLNIPVMILGVYPSLKEDATAQYNAMKWQSEVEKFEIPYIILDNQDNLPKLQAQEKVNNQAAQIVSVLTGQPFGETNLSSIDNRDMFMLLSHIGKRICVYTTNKKPSVGETIEDALVGLLSQFNEPAPAFTRGYGLFIKAPADILNNADTSLVHIREICGNAPVQYTHMEESADITIALICSGCAEASDRVAIMKEVYDEIQSSLKESHSTVSSLLDGIDDPLGMPVGKAAKKSDEMDLSALDM